MPRRSWSAPRKRGWPCSRARSSTSDEEGQGEERHRVPPLLQLSAFAVDEGITQGDALPAATLETSRPDTIAEGDGRELAIRKKLARAAAVFAMLDVCAPDQQAFAPVEHIGSRQGVVGANGALGLGCRHRRCNVAIFLANEGTVGGGILVLGHGDEVSVVQGGQDIDEEARAELGEHDCQGAVVAPPGMEIAREAMTGPASIFGTTSMMLTPTCSSPARMADVTGEAPRQRGSRDAWSMRTSASGVSSTARGRIWP
ncbi:MAG: hypothetical protein U5Q44_02045 [Dehalococcoidia bacterium]|nr:hypothetical protein [Dehalococcoidia bacterium]